MTIKPLPLLVFTVLVATAAAPAYAAVALKDRVDEGFKAVFARKPSSTEHTYWLGRVTRGEKKTYEALVGAMDYYKKHAPPEVVAGTIPLAGDDKQSLIKAVLPLFITVYGNNPTEAEKAWWRARITCGEIKKYSDLIASMKFHRAKKARKGSAAICGAAKAQAGIGGISRQAVAGISTHPLGDEVRIGIFKTDGRAIHVTADGQFQVRAGGETIATLGKDDPVQVSWSGDKYHVRGSGIEANPDEEVRFIPASGVIMKIANYADPSKTYPGKNYNRFRGLIEIRKCQGCNELWAINQLRTEHYLRGLAESSDTGPEEYLKALGIAARTYVLYHHAVTGGRAAKQGYDIGNTPNDQIYRGYEYESITPRLASTFNKVAGVIVTNADASAPLITTYFSDSDGKTRSAQEVWGSSRFPHLQSVADPFHNADHCVGHCVGLSAQGAFGFANKDHWDFQKILKYYYKGIRLVKAY